MLSLRPKIIPSKLLIRQSIFMLVIALLSGCYLHASITANSLLLWFSILTLGITLGWIEFRLIKIKAIQAERKLYIPNEIFLFLLIPFIVILVHYFGFAKTSMFTIQQTPLTNEQLLQSFMIYGLITGIILGRLCHALRCIKIGPYITHQEGLPS